MNLVGVLNTFILLISITPVSKKVVSHLEKQRREGGDYKPSDL